MSGRDLPRRYLELTVTVLPRACSDWGRAMLAELASIDLRSERWRFALGCTRPVVLQAAKAPCRMLAVAGAIGLVVGSEIVLANVIGQAVPLALALTLLLWLGSRPGFLGPVRSDPAARVVRASGYAIIVLYLSVLVVGSGPSGLLRPDPKAHVIGLLLILYTAASLAVTAERSHFGAVGLIAGTAAGLVAGSASFVVMPFERDGQRLAAAIPGHGSWLVLVAFGAPAAAALLTAGLTRHADQAAMAALCAGVFAALLIALLGLGAIVLFPDHIPDIVGPVMVPGTGAAARQAANATEASDPYAGLLLYGGLLAAILWAMARPLRRGPTRVVLVSVLGVPPVALGLSARHFPGATATAVTTAIVILAALIATTRSTPSPVGIDHGEAALS